jgi:hypothetical protein
MADSSSFSKMKSPMLHQGKQIANKKGNLLKAKTVVEMQQTGCNGTMLEDEIAAQRVSRLSFVPPCRLLGQPGRKRSKH